MGGCAFMLALIIALVDGAQASPPPVPRSNLPQIESDLRAKEPKVQLQALTDLSAIEGNLTSEQVRLVPRILQLCQSPDGDVVQSALSLTAKFCWIAEARKEHGSAIVEVIGKALQSKDTEVRKMAAYVAWFASRNQIVDDQIETALPILIAAADDREESVRVQITIALGLMEKADKRVITTLRRALADPAMQVRRQAALALAEHAKIGEEAIPELLAALRDQSGEVSGSAAHALAKMGAATEPLFKLTDDADAQVRHLAISTLSSGHIGSYSKVDKNFQRIASMVHRKLDDPDAAVQREAAIRVSFFGSLDARVAAIPILVKNATGKESLDGWNAYLGIGRCIREFASGLTDKDRAETALRGLKQFDKDFLKSYLQESHQKFRTIEGGDVRPLLKSAAERGINPAHRELAAEMLSWLPQQEGK
jgi:HEAT repeat protein